MPALSETEMRARVMGTTSASEPDGVENASIGFVSYELRELLGIYVRRVV